MNLGIAGEVRCIVRNANGDIETDTGFQKNLILDQGLEFFGGEKGSALDSFCLIGSGNSSPINTQNSLDAYVAKTSGSSSVYKDDYADDGSGLYKIHKTSTYKFGGLGDVNIAEVGLASAFTSSSNYYLCTRALVKDHLGAATIISLKTGEVLEVYYRVWEVFSTADTVTAISMLDGVGGSTPYNTTARLAGVGSLSNFKTGIANPILGSFTGYSFESADLVAPTTFPSGARTSVPYALSPYTPNSHKRVVTFSASLTQGLSVRTLAFTNNSCGAGVWQIRFGSVADDSPIPKTNKDTLTIPLEFSWGRYEGAL